VFVPSNQKQLGKQGALTASNITHDSHYVPQAILRRWSEDGIGVYAYRILVSNASVPEWKRRPIRGLAYQRDLYTSFAGNREADAFERWIAEEFEQPGLAAIEAVVAGRHLKPDNWRCLARFVAAQDVRTPLSYFESMKRWDQEMPAILDNTLAEAVIKLQAAKDQGIKLETKSKPNPFDGLFRVKTELPTDPASDQAFLHAEVTLGRPMWIASMRHLVTGAANVLSNHRWSVAGPYGKEEWPLTDHPVLRLNYYEPGRYDFCGGWNNPGSELIMPMSPKLLLYVQVGKKVPNRFNFSSEKTRLLQGLLAQRAHRWIFATQPLPWVAQARPRLIDPEMLRAEEAGWKRWHKEQSRAEVV